MTINIFVLKREINGKIVVVRFFFCWVYVLTLLKHYSFSGYRPKFYYFHATFFEMQFSWSPLNVPRSESKIFSYIPKQESLFHDQTSPGLDFRLYDGSDLKTYLLMRWWGPMLWLLSGPPGFTCWISFALVFSFIYSFFIS